MVENEFQDRSMFLFKSSHGRYVVDQRSGDGRLSGRSSDVATSIEGHRFPNWRCLMRRLRLPWKSCSTRMCTSEKEWVSKSNALKNTTYWYEETNCIHDLGMLLRVTGAHETVLFSYGSVQFLLTWRRHPRFWYQMGSDSIINKWST